MILQLAFTPQVCLKCWLWHNESWYCAPYCFALVCSSSLYGVCVCVCVLAYVYMIVYIHCITLINVFICIVMWCRRSFMSGTCCFPKLSYSIRILRFCKQVSLCVIVGEGCGMWVGMYILDEWAKVSMAFKKMILFNRLHKWRTQYKEKKTLLVLMEYRYMIYDLYTHKRYCFAN